MASRICFSRHTVSFPVFGLPSATKRRQNNRPLQRAKSTPHFCGRPFAARLSKYFSGLSTWGVAPGYLRACALGSREPRSWAHTHTGRTQVRPEEQETIPRMGPTPCGPPLPVPVWGRPAPRGRPGCRPAPGRSWPRSGPCRHRNDLNPVPLKLRIACKHGTSSFVEG